MASLILPDFSLSALKLDSNKKEENDNTWGPSSSRPLPINSSGVIQTKLFSDLPFAPFTKRDQINYVADWTPKFVGGRIQQRYERSQRQRVGDDQARLGNFGDEEDDFGGTVISKKMYKDADRRKDRTAQRRVIQESHEKLRKKETHRLEHAPQSKYRPKQRRMQIKRKTKWKENPRPTQISIKKQDNWQLLKDLWFNTLLELSIDKPSEYNGTIKILETAGEIHRILSSYETIMCRTPMPLRSLMSQFSDSKYIHFDYTTASCDPIMQRIARDAAINLLNYKKQQKQLKNQRNNNINNNNNNIERPKYNVFTTDTVLAVIMCIVRSKYSFDFVITKIGNNIFLDQRSKINSFWSVDETSQQRPTKKNAAINKYTKLATEATWINHVYSEQLVSHKPENIIKLDQNNPFLDNIDTNYGKHCASTAFIYKSFDLKSEAKLDELELQQLEKDNENKNNENDDDETENILLGTSERVYVRCTAHGYDKENSDNLPKQGGSTHKNVKFNNLSLVSLYALNQYDASKSKTDDWNKELDLKLSGILLTEITNNTFKCTRWATQAILAGSDYINLGFVTRVKPSDTMSQNIVGVKKFSTYDFMKKCAINLRHDWAIFHHIIDIIRGFEDGRFVAVRDPLKQVIRFYKVDPNSFGKDDEVPSFKQLSDIVSVSDDITNN